MHYGPEPGTTWDELYCIYLVEDRARLSATGCFDPERRAYWPITNSDGFQAAVDDLLELLEEHTPHRDADRIDLACMRVLSESLSGLMQAAVLLSTCLVLWWLQMRRYTIFVIWSSASQPGEYDWNQLIREHGISPTHFRRRWQDIVGVPPARYRTQLCLRLACEILANTQYSISEVATQVGFTDRLYFARKFKQFTGMTASEWRASQRDEG